LSTDADIRITRIGRVIYVVAFREAHGRREKKMPKHARKKHNGINRQARKGRRIVILRR